VKAGNSERRKGMITIVEGKVFASGSREERLADLAIHIKTTRERMKEDGMSDEAIREDIAMAGRLAFMSAEELGEEIVNIMRGEKA